MRGDVAASETEPTFLTVTGGAAELFGNPMVAVYVGEFRFRANWRGIHPYVLGSWAKDGATYYGAGLLYNFDLTPRWRVTIGSGPGYYERNRSRRDLGHTLEFYSNLEVSARIGRDHRLGLSIGHISNGGFNRNHNPGSETLRLVYSIPLR